VQLVGFRLLQVEEKVLSLPPKIRHMKGEPLREAADHIQTGYFHRLQAKGYIELSCHTRSETDMYFALSLYTSIVTRAYQIYFSLQNA
jgi:hypothetical protein